MFSDGNSRRSGFEKENSCGLDLIVGSLNSSISNLDIRSVDEAAYSSTSDLAYLSERTKRGIFTMNVMSYTNVGNRVKDSVMSDPNVMLTIHQRGDILHFLQCQRSSLRLAGRRWRWRWCKLADADRSYTFRLSGSIFAMEVAVENTHTEIIESPSRNAPEFVTSSAECFVAEPFIACSALVHTPR